MNTIRVLIVDDSVTIRAMLEQVISSDPSFHVVGIAADIATARALMRSSAPDVMTLDLAMPGVDGLHFLRSLKGQRHPPIVVVSASSKRGTAETEEALEAGAAACFDKSKLLSDQPKFVRALKRSVRCWARLAAPTSRHVAQ